MTGKRTTLLFLALAIASSSGSSSTRFNVLFPEFLNREEGYDHLRALFGPTTYQVTGNLVYAGSEFCDSDDVEALSPSANVDDDDGPLILMIDRGACTFVQKVRNAQRTLEGAVVGVLISNNVCICSDEACQNNGSAPSCETQLPIMADDGSASDIRIPSMLLFKSDADRLKDVLLVEQQAVVVEMVSEKVQTETAVAYELFTTPSNPDSLDFLLTFKRLAVTLGVRAVFQPRMFLYDGTTAGCFGNGDNSCYNLCTNNGRYCANDPDGDLDVGISGADVVRESLRRICIWTLYDGGGIGEAWWDYVESFYVYCSSSDLFADEDCIRSVYADVGINANRVEDCMDENGGVEADVSNLLLDTELAAQQERQLFTIPSLYINGNLLSGPLTASRVLEEICEAYVDGFAPDICESTSLVPGSRGRILQVGSDNPGFRQAIRNITQGPVDNYLTEGSGVKPPSLADMLDYDCVMIHSTSFAGTETFGEHLADFVDRGGTVVFSDGFMFINNLGRFKGEGYSPITVPQLSNELSIGDLYTGDGSTLLYEGVNSFRSVIDNRDEQFELQFDGIQDGTYESGTIAAAYRPDFRVVYLNGSYCWRRTFPDRYCLGGDHPRRWANACSVASVLSSPRPSVSPTPPQPNALLEPSPTSPPSSPSPEPSVPEGPVTDEFTMDPSTSPETLEPSFLPSSEPSKLPSLVPSEAPSAVPSRLPSSQPSQLPSLVPSVTPSGAPSLFPSFTPTIPPNDICENAIELSPDSLLLGSTADGLLSTTEAPQCSPLQGLWYTSVGEGAPVTISTCHEDTDFSTALAMYTGDCENLILRAWVGSKPLQGTCGEGKQGSIASFVGQQDERYFVLVHGDVGRSLDESGAPQQEPALSSGTFGLSLSVESDLRDSLGTSSSPTPSSTVASTTSSAASISDRWGLVIWSIMVTGTIVYSCAIT